MRGLSFALMLAMSVIFGITSATTNPTLGAGWMNPGNGSGSSGGGGSGCPTGGDCTFNSVTAVRTTTDTAVIHVLNPYMDTLFLPRPLVLWNRMSSRPDSVNQRDWVLIGNGSASFMGHVDSYLYGHPYPWGPDSGLRAYSRLKIGVPRPDSDLVKEHRISSESSGGYKLNPIVFYMTREGNPIARFFIDTLNSSLGWSGSYGGFYAKTKMIITPDFGGGTQPFYVNASSVFEINNDSGSVHATLVSHAASIGGSAQLTGYQTGGTRTSPSATTSNSQLIGIFGRGWANGDYTTSSAGGISIVADRDWTGSSQGSYIRFHASDSGRTTSGIVGQFYRQNLFIGPISIVTGGKQNLVLVNTATAPTIITDRVALYASDNASAASVLSIYQESAPVADVGLASTHSALVRWNGAIYKIALTLVP